VPTALLTRSHFRCAVTRLLPGVHHEDIPVEASDIRPPWFRHPAAPGEGAQKLRTKPLGAAACEQQDTIGHHVASKRVRRTNVKPPPVMPGGPLPAVDQFRPPFALTT